MLLVILFIKCVNRLSRKETLTNEAQNKRKLVELRWTVFTLCHRQSADVICFLKAICSYCSRVGHYAVDKGEGSWVHTLVLSSLYECGCTAVNKIWSITFEAFEFFYVFFFAGGNFETILDNTLDDGDCKSDKNKTINKKLDQRYCNKTADSSPAALWGQTQSPELRLMLHWKVLQVFCSRNDILDALNISAPYVWLWQAEGGVVPTNGLLFKLDPGDSG